MYQETFFEKHPHLLIHLQKVAKEVNKACAEGSTEKIKEAHTTTSYYSVSTDYGRDELF